jgi:sortase (surface protein transpeptidase)
LGPGDTVQITDADGHVFSYAVQWIKLYDANTAPVDEIFAPTEDEAVTLITCGGAFDPTIHMYVSRWVVRATRIGDSASDPLVSAD